MATTTDETPASNRHHPPSPDRAPRPAGSDAERRAAQALADALRQGRRKPQIATFWCRPNWALAQAINLIPVLAGSLIAVDHAKLGAALILVSLVLVVLDWTAKVSPGRLLTFERASQNVIVPPPHAESPVTLIVTAPYDSARTGLATALRQRGVTRRIQRPIGNRAPGWLGWTVLLIVWTLATALLRLRAGNQHNLILGLAQLISTVALVLGEALLLEASLSTFTPDRDLDASADAAIALAKALQTAPPANLQVELVLTGAGSDEGLGLRQYLRRHRKQINRTNVVILGIEATDGAPQALVSDGPLTPQRFFSPLIRLAKEAGFEPTRQRGCSPALPGRMRRLPALTLTGEQRQLLPLALELTDAIDVFVAELQTRRRGR